MRAWGSASVSLFIPGLGSWINGERVRGALYFGGYVGWWVYILSQPIGSFSGLQSVVVLVGAALYFFQIADAYLAAKRWNKKQQVIE